MRIGVAHVRREAVPCALRKTHLQAVVRRAVTVTKLVNLREVGKLGVEGPGGLLQGWGSRGWITAGNLSSSIPGTKGWLIDVGESQQLGSMRSDIGDFQGEVTCEGSLHI